MNREITIMDFFRFVLSKLKLILIFGCIAAIIAAGFTYFTARTSYHYNGSFIVDPFGNVDENFNSNNIYNELTISRTLIPSLVELLQKKDFANKVAKQVNEEMGTNVTSDYIINSARYSINDETLIIDFRCSSTSKKLAYTVAKTISEKAPNYVEGKLNRANMNVVDSVTKDVFTTSRTDYKLAAVIAFAVIAVLTVLVCLIIELLDNRVKNVDDLTEHFDYPVLGTIPDFYSHSRKEKGYYGKQQKSKEVEAK